MIHYQPMKPRVNKLFIINMYYQDKCKTLKLCNLIIKGEKHRERSKLSINTDYVSCAVFKNIVNNKYEVNAELDFQDVSFAFTEKPFIILYYCLSFEHDLSLRKLDIIPFVFLGEI